MNDEGAAAPMDDETHNEAEQPEANAEAATDSESSPQPEAGTEPEPTADAPMAEDQAAVPAPEGSLSADDAAMAEAQAAPDEASTASGPAGAPEPVGASALELYFLRHADAGDPMTWAGDDSDRPLSKKGRRQARRLGAVLADLDLRVDGILTSPRLRSADTAKIVGKAIGSKRYVDDRLGLDFTEMALSELVAGLHENARAVILVGHDPDFSHLVSWLVGASITMRKGALARVDLADRTVSAGHGSLRWLLPPDAVAG